MRLELSNGNQGFGDLRPHELDSSVVPEGFACEIVGDLNTRDF